MSIRFTAILQSSPPVTVVDLVASAEQSTAASVSGLLLGSSIPKSGAGARRRTTYVWVHDLTGTCIGVIARNMTNLVHDEAVDRWETLRFELPATDPKAYLVAVDHQLRVGDRWFRVTVADDVRADARTLLVVEAEAMWYELLDAKFVGSLVLDDVTAAAGLAEILAGSGSGWTVDATTTTDPTLWRFERQDRTALELVRAWAAITGTFVVFDTGARTVALVASRGRDRGMSFRYARNMRTVRRRTRPPEATRLYPYGSDRLTIAGVNGGVEYLEDFSYYTDQGLSEPAARARFTRAAVWVDATLQTEAALLAAAESRIAVLARPRVSYEAAVVDLSELSGIDEDVAPSDVVRVHDDDLGITVSTEVAALRRWPLEPWRNEVQLALFDGFDTDDTSSERPAAADEWQQFIGDNSADYLIRDDGTWSVNRLGLRFRAGGRASFHVDALATGVGAGVLWVSVVEAVDDTTVYPETPFAYTDGDSVHVALSWAAEDLRGSKDYRVRYRVAATGGADPGNGVDIDLGAAHWWVWAFGAVQETPPAGTESERFDYTGAVQTFTVPDNVTEVTIEAAGGAGGGWKDTAYLGSRGGDGGGLAGRVTATFSVVSGSTLDVYVGAAGGCEGAGGGQFGGWPNGGDGLTDGSGGVSGGGGGASYVIEGGGAFADAMIVAPAGGGHAQLGPSRGLSGTGGGDGGFWSGSAGADAGANPLSGGQGATNTAGGTGGHITAGDAENGDTDGQGHGGDAVTFGGPFPFPAGGGGGGWHGGGAGVGVVTVGGGKYGGDGGGGSGHVSPAGFDLLIEDGVHGDADLWDGYVLISWTPPPAE